MFTNRETDRIEPERNVEFIMKVDRNPPNWNPPISRQLTFKLKTPAYRRYYSKIRSDDDTDRKKWKDCEHYSCYTAFAVPPEPPTHEWYSSSGTGTCNYQSAGSGADPLFGFRDTTNVSLFGAFGEHMKPKLGNILNFPTLMVVRPDGGFIPPPKDLDGHITNSLRAMLPGIKAELSVLNSLIELKDFKSLPQTLTNLINFSKSLPRLAASIPRMVTGLRNIRSSFGTAGATLREALRLGADAYLQKQFNIDPTLRDICSIYAALQRTHRRVNDMIVRQGRRQLRHFSSSWLPIEYSCTVDKNDFSMNGGQYSLYSTNTGETGCPMSLTGCSLTMNRYAIVEEATFHAEVEYNYSFTRFQVENAQLLGLLDAFGINLNPAIIWNAIPWSFLIDWVISVSKWLSGRATLNLEPQINISRYMWSSTVKRRVRCYVSTNTAFPRKIMVPNMYLPDLYETAYRRNVQIPYSNSIFSSGLSSKELSLGAALAITRVWKPNNRRLMSAKRR